MGLHRVAITGRDRRHLTELRTRFRVVVAGGEDASRAIVDAYIPAERVDWLRKKRYGVEFLEDVETQARTRQAENRAAVETRRNRRRYGDVIWGEGYLTVDEIEEAIKLAKKNYPDVLERIP